MGIRDVEECRVYDEVDGTEIDDDECLALCDNSRVYVIGAEWKPATSSPVPSPVVSPASTAVSKPVTAISFDASPVSAGAGSVIINEAEGSGEMSESSIDGYDNWMETDIDIITSTPKIQVKISLPNNRMKLPFPNKIKRLAKRLKTMYLNDLYWES